MKRITWIGLLTAAIILTIPYRSSAGTFGTSRARAAAVLPAPPAAPGSIKATAGNSNIVVTWPAVANATGYRVYRAIGDVWDEQPIAKTTSTSFKNYNLTNGTKYSYRVSAYNGGGSGPLSIVADAIPLAPPSGVTAAAGNTMVTLQWTEAAGATSYDVIRGTTSTIASMASVASGLTTPTFVDTGLTNGVKQYYRVRSHGTETTSAYTPAVSATPQPPPPATAPANLRAVPGNARVTLTWDPVADATSYKIFRSTIAGVFGETAIASVTTPTFRNTGLVNGTQYFYKVAGRNGGGLGPASFVDATATAPPAPPTDVAASAGDQALTLTWTPSANATSYNVYRATSPGREGSTPYATGVTAPPFADPGVQNGPTYYYKVTALNAGGESARSAEASASPEAPQPPADPATIAAYQLLRQATWGPRPGDVDALKSLGRDAFLSAQFAAPPSEYPSTLFNLSTEDVQEHFMSLALTGSDQLRQRVAWALHKIWVVSAVEVPMPDAIVTYQRILMNGAFGNYRDLMRDITLNPAMGHYLNMLNNRSQAVTGSLPNENYPRELMQLFTVGIPRLNANGTPMVDGAGVPLTVYTEQDVKELARIFTGWTFGDGNPSVAPRRLASENYKVPMEAVEAYHDKGAKMFLGEPFSAGQTARADLDHALDVLFNHSNMGPFVGRQLIQQLVTSNPSPAYVAAVAATFDNNGAGVRGDLAAVVRAVLTHPEASVSTLTSGKLAEPVLFVTSILRALNASVTDHPFMSDKAESMGQKVFYPPSVFSYFSPGYRVRGTTGANGAPLGGPEYQILTAVTALERANFVGELLGGYYGTDVSVDYTPFTSRATDPGALVDYCSLVFMAGRMSSEERTEIMAAVRATPAGRPLERARTALYLTLTAAQSQVDR